MSINIRSLLIGCMLAYSIYSGLSFVVVMANKSVKNALIRFSGLIGLLIAFLLEDHPGWLGNQGQEILFLGLSVFVTLSLFFGKRKAEKMIPFEMHLR